MTSYFLSVILIVISAGVAIVGLVIGMGPKKKAKRGIIELFLGIAGIVIGMMHAILIAEIPKPEIYTTNSNSSDQNQIYFRTGMLLRVKYTLVPYADPAKDGEWYRENIPINGSMTVSAKSTLFGIKWSELVIREIIVGDDNEITVVDPDDPGVSIVKITAHLADRGYYPGYQLNQEDMKVEGETAEGNKVPIEEFSFEPEVLMEGENEIQITYKDLFCTLTHTVLSDEIIGNEKGDIEGELYKDGIPSFELPEVNEDIIIINDRKEADLEAGQGKEYEECPISEMNFPDETFRSYVKMQFDLDRDEYLSLDERNAVKEILLDDYGIIETLDGIEYFYNLEKLMCDGNRIQSLDLKNNQKIKVLTINNNLIGTIDVSQNEQLEEFYCANNLLTELDVSNNSKLTYLDCSNNMLGNLRVDSNPKLRYLRYDGNLIQEVDIHNNKKLVEMNGKRVKG